MAEETEYYEIKIRTNCGEKVCLGSLYATYVPGKGLEISHVNIDSNMSPPSKKLESEIKKISEKVFKESDKDGPSDWHG